MDYIDIEYKKILVYEKQLIMHFESPIIIIVADSMTVTKQPIYVSSTIHTEHGLSCDTEIIIAIVALTPPYCQIILYHRYDSCN